MTAREYVTKKIVFTEIKPIWDQSIKVMQGFLCVAARAKNGKLVKVPIGGSGIFQFTDSICKETIEMKKEVITESIIDKLEQRGGIKGYKGRFKLERFGEE